MLLWCCRSRGATASVSLRAVSVSFISCVNLRMPSAYLVPVLAECQMNFGCVLFVKSANGRWLGDCCALFWFWFWWEHRGANPLPRFQAMLLLWFCGRRAGWSFICIFVWSLPVPQDLMFVPFPMSSQYQTGIQLVHPASSSHSLVSGVWPHLSSSGDVSPSQEKQMVFVSGDKTGFPANLKQTLSNLHLRKWGCKVESLHLDPAYLRPFTLGRGKDCLLQSLQRGLSCSSSSFLSAWHPSLQR